MHIQASGSLWKAQLCSELFIHSIQKTFSDSHFPLNKFKIRYFHMRSFDYQYKNCFRIFIFNLRTLSLRHTESHFIFKMYFSLCYLWAFVCVIPSVRMDGIPLFSFPLNILPWPCLECYHGSWSMWWCLRIWEIHHLEKFWVFDFLCFKLATRVHFLVCQ